jgi:predicted RNA polymerase sigma factor
MGAPTLMQIKAASAYAFSNPIGNRPTQTEIARSFGVSQPAISQRLDRFKKRLTTEQRDLFTAAVRRARPGRRRKATQIQI